MDEHAGETVEITPGTSYAGPETVKSRFVDALRGTPRGSPRPSIDDFLVDVPDADRETLREELRALEKTILDGQAFEDSGATTDLGPDGAESRSDATTDFHQATTSPIGLGPSAEDGATVSISGEPGPTVDAPSRLKESIRPGVTGPDPSRYEILGELGRGGMGVVYKARQIGLNRLVALKMILGGAHARPDELARFRAEALAVAAIRHPNIVQIFDVGEVDGLPYFALEYVEGGNLAKLLDGKPIAPARAAELTRTLALGLAAAHEQKIIHRDLKPANILISTDGEPKITDFGLAKRLEGESGQTHTGSVMGTPSYMSPEQAWGHTAKIGPRADIYSLGAILYDCLTGRPPFQGVTILETLDLVRHSEPVSPAEIQPGVPRDLETICLKCLQKDQERRYASASELADDLGRFLRDEPILARPVSRAERTWRWARRNPWVAALGSAVALLLVAVAVGSTYFAIRLATETTKALDEAKKSKQAQAEEALARKDADQNAATAREFLNLTLDAERRFLFEIQAQLRQRPGLADIREAIIKSAMGDLDKLRQFAIQSPLMKRTDAASMNLLGTIYFEFGRINEASALFEKAFATLTAEDARNPNDPISKRNLAGITNKLADVALRLGDAPRARDLYASALTLRQRWWRMAPSSTAAYQAIGISYTLVGQTDLRLGDAEAAVEHYSAGLKIYQEVAKARPDDPSIRRSIATAEDMLGIARLRLNDLPGALEMHRVAQERRVALLEQTKDGSLRRDIALSQSNFGDLYQTAIKDPALAWVEYQKARELLETLAKEDEKSPAARHDLAMILYRLGDTAGRLKALGSKVAGAPEPGPAESYFADCLKIREELAGADPKDTQSRIELMLILARVGRPAEALAIVDGLLDQAGDDPQVRFGAACALALCATAPDPALAAGARDHALGVLADLVRLGWKDRFVLENDPDLEPIRSDPRFAAAIAPRR